MWNSSEQPEEILFCRRMVRCSNLHAENVLETIVTRSHFQLENEIHNASKSFIEMENRLSEISRAAGHLRLSVNFIMTKNMLQKVMNKLKKEKNVIITCEHN
jgi:hypothetical protein